jgi:Flp pilus assembly protein TadD
MTHPIFVAGTRGATGLAFALLGLLAGCSSAPRQGYGVSEAAQAQARERMAEAADTGEAAAQLDTQPTYVALVRRMQGNGLWFASLAHLDALEKRWGTTPETRLLRADALRQTGQAAEARALYARLAGTPLEGMAQHGMGLLAASEGQADEAIRAFERARALSPTDALLLGDLGYALLRAGRTAEARLPLMQAAQMQPDNARVQGNLALYLMVAGEREAAQALMNQRQLSAAARQSIARQAEELAPAPAGVAPTAAPASIATPGQAPALQLRSSLAWTSLDEPAAGTRR